MALTYSSMLPLSTRLINFNLPNTITGQIYSSTDIENNKPVLIMIICNHCPYVVHYHKELKKLHHDYSDKVSFVAISSNDIVNYPEDSPEKMRELWIRLGFSFPYLYDETQEVAKAFQAECTPEFYLFNQSHDLVYRGRCDETSPKSSEQPNGQDLRAAINAVTNGQLVNSEQLPSMGCNIKWKGAI